MESEGPHTHTRPQTSTETAWSLWVPEGSSLNAAQRLLGADDQHHRRLPLFFISVVLVLPQLRRSRILSVSRKRDERGRGVKVPYIKQRRQKEMNTGCNFPTFSAAAFIRLAAEIFMEVPGVLEPLGRCGNHYGFFPLLQENCRRRPITGQ